MATATLTVAVGGMVAGASSSGGQHPPEGRQLQAGHRRDPQDRRQRRRRPPRHVLRLLHDHLRAAPHGEPAARLLQGQLRRRARPGTPVPDIATYTISPNGLTYTFHIKQGVMWDTPTGPRQVTSQDEVRGIKRLCNPISAAPPITYWTNNIAGMTTYCAAFAEDHACRPTRPLR